MKRILVFLILLSVVAGAGAQSRNDAHDFSGTWKRDDSVTSSTTTYSYGVGVSCQPEILEILHSSSELQVRSTVRCYSVTKGHFEIRGARTYYLDGRGEFNDLNGASTTKWDGKKILTLYTAQKNGKDVKFKRVYEISKKLDKITIVSGPKDDPVNRHLLEVFRKQV